MNPETFPPAHGVPLELLTERGLHIAFIDVVEESQREGLPVVVDRSGTVAEMMPDQLGAEVAYANNRIAKLDAEIAKYRKEVPL